MVLCGDEVYKSYYAVCCFKVIDQIPQKMMKKMKQRLITKRVRFVILPF